MLSRHRIRKPGTEKLTLVWPHEKCTDRMESAFSRLSKRIRDKDAGKVILDMRKCVYLSVGGMHLLLDWYLEHAGNGIEIRITGLDPIFRKLFRLSKLEWILTD